ncbi:Potassium-transporting ATPase ATP-binding subunit [Labeo rohita]|uniref:Potassium-transporting ATPase ATP-binding subunit n=1 Tax=Labeo rohita TaxID=84645 RepID=A0ABQ8L8M5_LABRO|nr:Potassium-transporting ATPase ATP-binding subunit [Labeo rohita]
MVTALVFLSCIGMVQNGDYISFQILAEVERLLPVTQKHLQECLVSFAPCSRPPEPEPTTEFLEEVVEEQVDEEVVKRIKPACVPASSSTTWTNLEMSYVDLSRQLSRSYEQYVRRCKEISIGVTTFLAFRPKCSRLMPDNK